MMGNGQMIKKTSQSNPAMTDGHWGVRVKGHLIAGGEKQKKQNS